MVPTHARQLAELYDRESGYVYANLRRLGVAHAELEDALQEVFIVAHKRFDTLREPRLGRAWLLGIARNVARHHHRGQRRRRRFLSEFAALPRATPDGRVWYERAVAARYLEHFLASLDAGQREAFVLVELEQLRGRELALAIGVSEAAAWSRLRRARRAFEAWFSEFDGQLVTDAAVRAAFLRSADAANGADDATELRQRVRASLPLPALAPAVGAVTGGAGWSWATLFAGPLSQGWLAFSTTVVALGGLFSAVQVTASDHRTPVGDDAVEVSRSRGTREGRLSREAAPARVVHDDPVAAEHLVAPPPLGSLATVHGERGPSVSAQPRHAEDDVEVQRAGLVERRAAERAMAGEIERLVRLGRDDEAERVSIEYFDTYGAGAHEARVRALRVAVFCRQGKVAMAATERRLFAAAAPDEATSRAPWLRCPAIEEAERAARRRTRVMEREFEAL